jgi:hypothetical protein
MSEWGVILLVVVVAALALGLGWALARARHAERALDSAQRSGPPSRRSEEAWRAPASAVRLSPPRRVPPPLPPEAIVVGSAASPVAIVTRAERGRAGRVVPVELPPAARQALGPLLQHAPRVLAAAGDLATGLTRVVVKFSPEAARGLAAGTLEMTRAAGGEGVRAIARDVASKRFVEHGVLTNGVSPVAVASAIWQVAALVTAQKFLADINARLAILEQGIDAIRGFLEDQEQAKLRTSALRLREMADAVRDQRLSPRELDVLAHQIEDIDREAQQITELYAQQLARGSVEIMNQAWDASWTSASTEVGSAKRSIREAGERSAAYLTSVEVRVVANMLRGAVGMSGQLAEARLRQVEKDLSRHEDLLVELATTVRAKVPTLKATFQWKETDAQQQNDIRLALSKSTDPATAAQKQLAHVVSKAAGLVRSSASELSSAQELELDLRSDGTIVSAAHRLSA